MFFRFSVWRGPWSSEMESLSWFCVSLLTADWSKGTKIKTSVNCIKARQTRIIITGRRRWRRPLCLHSQPSCQQHMRKSYAAAFFSLCLLVCLRRCWCSLSSFCSIYSIREFNLLVLKSGRLKTGNETCDLLVLIYLVYTRRKHQE